MALSPGGGRAAAKERSVKALDKRVAALSSLLVASTLLNLALGAATGPLRTLLLYATGFFGLKALPALK